MDNDGFNHELESAAPGIIDPLTDAAWRTAGEEVLADVVHADAPLPSEACALASFSLGHTVSYDETGVHPQVVMTLGLVPMDGPPEWRTVLFPPEAARAIRDTLGGTLERMGEPTVRDLLRVDL
jgi:hypothetical protein